MIRLFAALALVCSFAPATLSAQDTTTEAASADAVPAIAIEDMVLGNPDAAVEVIEYASFTCPHCATFHEGTFKKLREQYIDNDKIKFVFREIYFDRPGLWASMIARCGGEERFYGIIDQVMAQQRDWIGDGSGAGIIERLRVIGLSSGLSEEELDACMTDADQAQALVTWFEDNAKRDDVRSTPSFIINGAAHPNMSYEDMAELLDGLLAEAE